MSEQSTKKVGRPPKVDEKKWCKSSMCTSFKGHPGDCKPATTPNEISARGNCPGPHLFQATLLRLSAANGAEDGRPGAVMSGLNDKPGAGWDAVAAASAANEAPPKPTRGKKGEQQRFKIDARDEVEVPAKHELHRDMTDDEWREQSALLAHDRVELMTLEEELAALKRKHAPRQKVLRENTAKAARQCDVKKWMTVTDCIEVHDLNRREVTVYASVNGARGVEVKPPRTMRADEYERHSKAAPFEAPDDDDAHELAGDGEEVEVEDITPDGDAPDLEGEHVELDPDELH